MKFLGLLGVAAAAVLDDTAFEAQEDGKVQITNFQCDGQLEMSMDLVYTPGDGRGNTKPGNWGCLDTTGAVVENISSNFDYTGTKLKLNPYLCARDANNQPDPSSTVWGTAWNTGDFTITWNAEFAAAGLGGAMVHVAKYKIPVSCTYANEYSVDTKTKVQQKTSTTTPDQAFTLANDDFEINLDSGFTQDGASAYRANDVLQATLTAVGNYLKLADAMEFAPSECNVSSGGQQVDIFNVVEIAGADLQKCGLKDLGFDISRTGRSGQESSSNTWTFSYITFVMGTDAAEQDHEYTLACTIKVCNDANTGSDCTAAENCAAGL